MFQAGKITFTQTLAKKDEDQKNLHSWFGGRPGASKSKKLVADSTDSVRDEDKEYQDKDKVTDAISAIQDQGNTADGQECIEQVKKLSQETLNDLANAIDDEIDIEEIFDNVVISQSDHNHTSQPNQGVDTTVMDQSMDRPTDRDTAPDFDILEDDSAEAVPLDQGSDLKAINPFKVPALPNHAQQAQLSPSRLPLSPMSPSDVNVRNFQSTMKVSSFQSRLEKAKIETTPSTQAVRDILSGICTQDLADDMEDLDKENDEPDLDTPASISTSPVKSAKHSSPLKNESFATKVDATAPALNKSFNSIADSIDYDSIFFEIDGTEQRKHENNDNDDFDDCGLDDATLLSLPPATQLISSARNSTPSLSTLGATPVAVPITRTKSSRQPLTKTDSFALAFEGLDDDDLLAGLNEYERSQNKTHPTPTATAVSMQLKSSTSASTLKKKRALPWERQSWSANIAGTDGDDDGVDVNEDADGDVEMATQDTEVLSSFG